VHISHACCNIVKADLDKAKLTVYNSAMPDRDLSESRPVISTCPVCAGDLHVTRLHCDTCGTTIEGRFNAGRFAQLDREQMALLESFLRARGNLRELERALRVSYPTVRNRVESVLRELGLGDGPAAADEVAEPNVDAETRRDILERLARHQLTADQAAAELGAAGATEIDSTEQE
jgi:hypothetical protein